MAVRDDMTETLDVAVVGEIYEDHIFYGFECWPAPGEEHFTDHYVREAGGGAAITACVLARLGRNVAIFAVVGEQDNWLRRRLQDFSVNVTELRQSATASAVSVGISTRDDRSFFTWPGANSHLPDYLREPKTQRRLIQARHVHFAMPIHRELALELFPLLRAAGCTISLDVGHHPDWLQDQRNWRTCAEVDFFLPNEREAQTITGNREDEELIGGLRSRGITNFVMKLGPKGAFAAIAGKSYQARALAVDAVDTTGAGDAFDAGLIDALLDEAKTSEMLERACICGSLSTRKAGALTGLPNRKELNHFYDELKQR